MNNELQLTNKDGIITSLELLEQINFFRSQADGKNELLHKTLLEVIRDEFEEEISRQEILPSEYTNSRGKKYPMFNLTYPQAKQVLVRESKIVRKAVIAYIETLESKLSELDNKNKLLLQLFSQDPIMVATAHKELVKLETQPLIDKIEEDETLVSFAQTVSSSSDCIDMNQMAKLCNKENINIGRNRLFDWLRDKKILMKNNIPYQKFINSRHFEVVEMVKDTPYGEKVFTKTLVTGKGQIYIVEKLRESFDK